MHLHGVLIKSGFEDYYLHCSSSVPPYAFVERAVLVDNIITGCLGDFTRMQRLRSFVCDNDVMHYSLHRMNDHQVLDAVRHMINSGRAVVVKKRRFLGNQFLKYNGKNFHGLIMLVTSRSGGRQYPEGQDIKEKNSRVFIIKVRYRKGLGL